MPLSNPLAATVADVSSVQNALYGAAGIAAFPAAAAAANDVSLAEVLRYIQETQIGTLTNTGGTATLGGILGNPSNVALATSLATILSQLSGAAGIAAFPAAAAAANDVSLAEVLRYIQESQIGTLTNTGGTATLGALIGDMANEPIYNRLYEIERHFHNYERWFGLANTPTATHKADRIGKTESGGAEAPFQIDAGNDDWGTWVQLLGEDDTPAVAGNTKWDIHRLMIVDSERDTATYFVQIGFGASGAAALAANTYTEFVYRAIATGNEETPIELMTRRQANDALAWARCFCIGQNTATLDFYVGLHEYVV